MRIEGLSKTYRISRKNKVHALNNINVTLDDTGLVCIVGKSGCGKTTFLNCIGTLDMPTEGRIYIQNENCEDVCLNELNDTELDKFRNLYLGIVFQDYNLIDEWTVEDNLRVALDIQNWSEKNKEDISKKIIETLNYVGLEDIRNRYIKELSGGQQQRVAIARAIIKNPHILLADEPTGNLDSENTMLIMELLKKCSQRCLVIVVTHDMENAEIYADRIIKMRDGSIINDINTDNESDVVETIVNKEITINSVKTMSFKNIFHLACNGLQVKKLKLVFSMLVLIIIFSVCKICTTVLCNDFGKTVSDYMTENEVGFLYTYKMETFYTREGLDQEIAIRNSKEIKEFLEEEFGKTNCYAVLESMEVSSMSSENSMECRLVVGGQLNDKYKLSGKMPKEKNEIVITDYLALMLDMEPECVGESIIVAGAEMNISGVVFLGAEEAAKTSYPYEVSLAHLYSDGIRLIVSDEYPQYLTQQENLYLPFTNLCSSLGIEGDMEHIVSLSSFSTLDSKDYELICGRMPENDSEILVSEVYSSYNLFTDDIDIIRNEDYGFMDIHNEEQNGVFSGCIGLYDYLSNVEIVGIVSGDVADILISDTIFSQVKKDYVEEFYADSYEVVLNSKTREGYDIYNKINDEKIKIDTDNIYAVYEQFEQIKHVEWFLLIVICIASILIILLLILFFSFNVKDNHKKIGILKSIGVSNKELMRIWLTEAMVVTVITWSIATIINVIVIRYFNSEFRRIYFYISDFVHYNISSEALIILILTILMIFTVVMPMWIMTDKRPVELMRRRA